MAEIWFTSDTHYWHSNIIRHCDRPFEHSYQMNEALIRRHNEMVDPDDTVFHLGDFAFASQRQIIDILNRLNGHYYMLRGNHDKWMRGFEGHERIEWIKDYHEMRHDGLVLCHYPLGSWNGMRNGSVMLHGHCHGNYEYSYPNSKKCGKIIDVGVDSHDYRPISLRRVMEIANGLTLETIPD